MIIFFNAYLFIIIYFNLIYRGKIKKWIKFKPFTKSHKFWVRLSRKSMMSVLISWLTNPLKISIQNPLKRKFKKNQKKNLSLFRKLNKKKKPKSNKRRKLKLLLFKNKITNPLNKKSKHNQNKMIIKIKEVILKNQSNLFQPFSFSNNNKKKTSKSFTPTQVSLISQKWWDKFGEDYKKVKRLLMSIKANNSKSNMKNNWNTFMRNILNKNLKSSWKKKRHNQKSKKKLMKLLFTAPQSQNLQENQS